MSVPPEPGSTRYGGITGDAALREAYAAEIAAFIAALKGGTEPPATGEDGLMALVLAEAALRSVAEGRVVRVTEVLGAPATAAD